MRRIELQPDSIEIVLTGLTMIGALQGRLVIPYANIRAVYPELHLPPRLLRMGGTSIGPIHEGHYIGEGGWYFLSYENANRVMTLDLEGFRLGRLSYLGIAIEVDDPASMAASLAARLVAVPRE
jgi:hypothetical protein